MALAMSVAAATENATICIALFTGLLQRSRTACSRSDLTMASITGSAPTIGVRR